MQREIILDTETTGLDPRGGDRLVEIGCVELVNGFATGNNFHQYINPERGMPVEAFNVHGLSEKFLSDKPKFAEVADGFVAYVGQSRLVIHNASFDMGFINAELDRAKRPVMNMERVVDTLMIARRKHPGSQNNLDALCRRYNIDNSSRTKHGALLDAELLAEVYLHLIDGHQARLNLAAEKSSGAEAPLGKGRARMRAIPLPERLSKAEIEAHDGFVASLGENALWLRARKAGTKAGTKD